MRDLENTVPDSQPVLSAAQLTEIDDLRSQNNLLKDQLASMSAVPGRDDLEDRIKDLNQRNLALSVELDQNDIIDDLKDELSDARSKQEVLEKGKASKLKADLLNEELSDARVRIQSLEKALVAAREAIRVLQGGGTPGSMIQVSNPSNFATNLGTGDRRSTSYRTPSYSVDRRNSHPNIILFVPGTSCPPY